MNDSFVKTSEQQNVIRSKGITRQLIIAGPGTGKTFTLIERLKYLIHSENLIPSQILILSFSVAAVREIKERIHHSILLKKISDETLFTEIRTFDSFGSRLIYELDESLFKKNNSYDDNIRIAVELILKNENAKLILNRYKHIFVDEIQDLVGHRAELTLEILKNTMCGFTIFGDPAQAIYDYLTIEDTNLISSTQFLKLVRENFNDLKEDIQLKKNFRIGDDINLLETAEDGRISIITESPVKSYYKIFNLFSKYPDIGTLTNHSIILNSNNSNQAILCRTNGQALYMASRLKENNIPVTLIVSLNDYSIPGWLGRLFGGYNSSSITKDDFISLLKERLDYDADIANSLWQSLFELINKKTRSVLSLMDLRTALTIDKIVVPEIQQNLDNKSIIISTIHRSKGREYGHVYIVMNENVPLSDEEKVGEARILYVGMTRARNKVERIMDDISLSLMKTSSGRWIKKTKKGRLTEIEVGLDGDINEASFVSKELFGNDLNTIFENQSDLWENINKNQTVTLERSCAVKKNPVYDIKTLIEKNNVTIGQMSVKFGEDLEDISNELHRGLSRIYPDKITGLWVNKIETIVGNLGDEDVPRKYRTTGLWIGLRLQGFGICHYRGG